MVSKVFVPVSDEMLFEHPELISSPLRPYRVGMPCYHWMAEIEYADKSTRVVQMRDFIKQSEKPSKDTDKQWPNRRIWVA